MTLQRSMKSRSKSGLEMNWSSFVVRVTCFATCVPKEGSVGDHLEKRVRRFGDVRMDVE